jgi:predicted SAM-dependent methyltransferase
VCSSDLHTQDPIGTITRHVEVLKPGGILYMAIPDKRFTFDRFRPNTTVEHFIRDHEEGPALSYIDHVREWVSLVDGKKGDEFDRKVQHICYINYSIHFHVWDINDMKIFLRELVINRYHIPVSILDIVENPERFECIFVLKKI